MNVSTKIDREWLISVARLLNSPPVGLSVAFGGRCAENQQTKKIAAYAGKERRLGKRFDPLIAEGDDTLPNVSCVSVH